ncbi:MAG: aminotransferase class I/II-fold pyridoxal phosphate-dependent enzyme, partial [Blastocatellia bacterium]|nr:aminotransferase class I/II-fold pyridoxal phosphate-dependent enzyme [Blastocatellia bacterium]
MAEIVMAKDFPVSSHVDKMQASSTLKAGQMAAELREQGHDVIDLTVGEPDFDTPEFVKEYARDGLAKGLTKYTPSAGTKLFQSGVADFYRDRFGSDFAPSEVAASCGGKQALFNAACTILEPGDEFLIPQPYWVTFPEIGTFCRAENVFIDTAETEFVLTADQVSRAITPKSKLLVINSPNNPTGRVTPPDEMRKIVEV